MRKVAALIGALEPRQRQTLILCAVRGRTQSCVAASLGISRQGVGRRLEAARQRLRSQLAADGGTFVVVSGRERPGKAQPGK
jgi:DNA-directed RNA polymerase specialized sigma24 family protein